MAKSIVIPTEPAKRESGGISQDTVKGPGSAPVALQGRTPDIHDVATREISPLRSPASRHRFGRDDSRALAGVPSVPFVIAIIMAKATVIPTEPVRLAALAQGRLRERRDLSGYESKGRGVRPWHSRAARQTSTMWQLGRSLRSALPLRGIASVEMTLVPWQTLKALPGWTTAINPMQRSERG